MFFVDSGKLIQKHQKNTKCRSKLFRWADAYVYKPFFVQKLNLQNSQKLNILIKIKKQEKGKHVVRISRKHIIWAGYSGLIKWNIISDMNLKLKHNIYSI